MQTTAAGNAQGHMDNVAAGGACLVDWELWGTRMTPDDLRVALARHGYDATIVPTIDQTAEVRRVGQKWRKGRGNAERYSAKVVFEDADQLVIGIRHDVQTAAKKNEALQFCTIVWDKVTETWGQGTPCPAEHQGARAALVAECDRERSTLDCDFIRPVLIQRVLKGMGAQAFIRRAGGAQVVPMVHYAEVERLAGLVCDLGDSYMGIVKVDMADQRTVQDMQQSVGQGLEKQVKAIREDLEQWRHKANRLPTGSIGERISRFNELRTTAQMYAQALGMAVDDLLSDIADAEADARLLLDRAMGRVPMPPVDGDGEQPVAP